MDAVHAMSELGVEIDEHTLEEVRSFLLSLVPQERNVQQHAMLCDELTRLYQKKNHDYGDSFH